MQPTAPQVSTVMLWYCNLLNEDMEEIIKVILKYEMLYSVAQGNSTCER